MTFRVPEKYRVTSGYFASDFSDGRNGLFLLPPPDKNSNLTLRVIATDEGGWEHVSVSLPKRCPNWSEMCHIKSIFWDDDDTVMQLHPPRSEWVNNHQYCLHLWRPIDADIPLPQSIFVGIKSLGVLA